MISRDRNGEYSGSIGSTQYQLSDDRFICKTRESDIIQSKIGLDFMY